MNPLVSPAIKRLLSSYIPVTLILCDNLPNWRKTSDLVITSLRSTSQPLCLLILLFILQPQAKPWISLEKSYAFLFWKLLTEVHQLHSLFLGSRQVAVCVSSVRIILFMSVMECTKWPLCAHSLMYIWQSFSEVDSYGLGN